MDILYIFIYVSIKTLIYIKTFLFQMCTFVLFNTTVHTDQRSMLHKKYTSFEIYDALLARDVTAAKRARSG